MTASPIHFGNPSYGIVLRLPGVDFAAALGRTREALAAEGFGIITEIDFAATMKKKLDADVAPYVILGACHPASAHQGVTAEPGVGLLLPCNVVVALEPEGCVVASIDPVRLFGVVGRPDVEPLAQDVKARIERALARLAT